MKGLTAVHSFKQETAVWLTSDPMAKVGLRLTLAEGIDRKMGHTYVL